MMSPMRQQPPKLLEIKPMPKELVESIRAEFRKLVDDPDFIGKLTSIERLAANTRELAVTLGDPSSDAMKGRGQFMSAPSGWIGEQSYGGIAMANPYGPGGGPEQFGARAIRELVNLIPSISAAARDYKQTSADLVDAIAQARQRGLGDIADHLEKKLLCSFDKPVEPVQPPQEAPKVEALNGAAAQS